MVSPNNQQNQTVLFPNHWIVLTSSIIVVGIPINPSLSKKLVQERIEYYNDTYDDFGDLEYDKKFDHTVRFNVYT